MKIQQKQAFCHPVTLSLSKGLEGLMRNRHKSVFRLLFLTFAIICSLPIGEGWGGAFGGGCYAQNSYSLPTASCQSQCGVETIDGWLGFMCHNLGADETLDPNTYVEGNADGSGGTLGWLFQWGRPADGHQLRNSPTTSATSNSPAPGHNMFIVTNANTNWYGQNNYDDFWGGVSNTKTANDPCPAGWKIPSQAQWDVVLASNTPVWTGNGYKIGNDLYLPAAGNRHRSYGFISNVGVNGYYLSSTVLNTYPLHLQIYGSAAVSSSGYYFPSYGSSVRCVAE